MSNKIQEFFNEKFGMVRATKIDDKIYFVGKDIAEKLGYVNPTKAISTHCKGVSKMGIPSNGGIQQMSVILEGDVFRLIVKSKLSDVEKFESWIMDIVLPAIRQDGAYIQDEEKVSSGDMSDDEFVLHAMTILQNKVTRLKEENLLLKDENADMKPIVDLMDKFINTNGLYDVGTYAKILESKELGRTRLFAWLKDKKILMSNNTPYQAYVDYFKVIPVVNQYTHRTDYKTLIRPKGITYIYKKLVKDGKVFSKPIDQVIEELSNLNTAS